jgi:hypothetical protein
MVALTLSGATTQSPTFDRSDYPATPTSCPLERPILGLRFGEHPGACKQGNNSVYDLLYFGGNLSNGDFYSLKCERRRVRSALPLNRTTLDRLFPASCSLEDCNITSLCYNILGSRVNWCHFSNYLGIEFCAYPASLGKESHPFLKHGGNA